MAETIAVGRCSLDGRPQTSQAEPGARKPGRADGGCRTASPTLAACHDPPALDGEPRLPWAAPSPGWPRSSSPGSIPGSLRSPRSPSTTRSGWPTPIGHSGRPDQHGHRRAGFRDEGPPGLRGAAGPDGPGRRRGAGCRPGQARVAGPGHHDGDLRYQGVDPRRRRRAVARWHPRGGRPGGRPTVGGRQRRRRIGGCHVGHSGGHPRCTPGRCRVHPGHGGRHRRRCRRDRAGAARRRADQYAVPRRPAVPR